MKTKTKRIVIASIFAVIISVVLFIVIAEVLANRAPQEPPRLYVNHRIGGATGQYIQAIDLSYEWRIGFRGSHFITRDPAMVFWARSNRDLSGNTLHLDDVGGEIELYFSDDLIPNSIYVRRWNAALVGNDIAILSQYESVAVSDNRTIRINYEDGNDYIYEVEAIWSRGYAFFTFRIKN